MDLFDSKRQERLEAAAKAAAQGHYSELIKALHSYDYR